MAELNLFASEQVAMKSPRLAWMERHAIRTMLCKLVQAGENPWMAWTGDLMDAIEREAAGYGETEDDALFEFAKKNGLRMWNEE